MVYNASRRFTDLLISSGLVTQQQLKQARAIHRDRGGSLTQILVQQGILEERDWLGVMAEKLGMPPLNLKKYRVEPDVAHLIPERIAKQYRLIPISRIGDRIVVAMSDPLNVLAIDDVKALTKYDLDLVLSSESDVMRAIDQYYHAGEERIAELVNELEREHAAESAGAHDQVEDMQGALAAASEEAPIVRLVDLIIREGLRRKASDIHLEPHEFTMNVRYRVDGLLQEAYQIPKGQQNAVLVRLKILSGVNITDWRLPQDGRFRMVIDGHDVDFRVSVLPIFHGGKIVLRILDLSAVQLGLDTLGFSEEMREKVARAVASPYGMILVTGPTGSGKSTTLYSILNQLNTTDRNIMTIEDPVEYQLDGISQLQVLPDIGLSFTSGLRALLRQTPDVIMIGEIRDGETADIATKASLTGQLILSTLHTNDAASAITRLSDMGIEPFLVASGVVMVAAQRLCRRLCQACREPYDPSPELRTLLGPDHEGPVYRVQGCQACHQSGYKGRMGLLEILELDDVLRDMIVQEATVDDIRNYACAHGMKLLYEDGMHKVSQGETSYEEVVRVTVQE